MLAINYQCWQLITIGIYNGEDMTCKDCIPSKVTKSYYSLDSDGAEKVSFITNGGFESNPLVAPSTAGTFNQNQIPNWTTDNASSLIEIWKTGNLGYTAYEGDSFVKVRATNGLTLFNIFNMPNQKIPLVWEWTIAGRSGFNVTSALQLVTLSNGSNFLFTLNSVNKNNDPTWTFNTGTFEKHSGVDQLQVRVLVQVAAGAISSLVDAIDIYSYKRTAVREVCCNQCPAVNPTAPPQYIRNLGSLDRTLIAPNTFFFTNFNGSGVDITFNSSFTLVGGGTALQSGVTAIDRRFFYTVTFSEPVLLRHIRFSDMDYVGTGSIELLSNFYPIATGTEGNLGFVTCSGSYGNQLALYAPCVRSTINNGVGNVLFNYAKTTELTYVFSSQALLGHFINELAFSLPSQGCNNAIWRDSITGDEVDPQILF